LHIGPNRFNSQSVFSSKASPARVECNRAAPTSSATPTSMVASPTSSSSAAAPNPAEIARSRSTERHFTCTKSNQVASASLGAIESGPVPSGHAQSSRFWGRRCAAVDFGKGGAGQRARGTDARRQAVGRHALPGGAAGLAVRNGDAAGLHFLTLLF
jgi:hypothetical protein